MSTHVGRLWPLERGAASCDPTDPETRLLLARPPLHASGGRSNAQVVPRLAAVSRLSFDKGTRAPWFSTPCGMKPIGTRAFSHQPLPINANCLYLLRRCYHQPAWPFRPPGYGGGGWWRGFAFHDALPRFGSLHALSGGILARAAVQRRNELLTLRHIGARAATMLPPLPLCRARLPPPPVKRAAHFQAERLGVLRFLDSSRPSALRSPCQTLRGVSALRSL